MKQHDATEPTWGRQMSLMFEASKVDEMNDVDRAGIITTLAQVLIQAAGLFMEERDDDQR